MGHGIPLVFSWPIVTVVGVVIVTVDYPFTHGDQEWVDSAELLPAINILHPSGNTYVEEGCGGVVHRLLLGNGLEEALSFGRVLQPYRQVFDGRDAVADCGDLTRLGDN